MNPLLDQLHPYPFEKLATLKSGTKPANLPHIALSIGEPKHSPPQFAIDALVANINAVANYPKTAGIPELRAAISDWATRRFNLKRPLNIQTEILPVNGTREALFAFAQACVRSANNAKVLMPNPFYQIYEGAAILAGAEPVFLNTTRANNFIPDFESISASTWSDCQLLYICNPGNPTGAVMNREQLEKLIHLAIKHDFILASDECYSELYFDENQPPVGLLDACHSAGNNDFKQCVVFHSLSKRSNLPGLRSGFVAGDQSVVGQFLKYRTYHGCAMPTTTQHASISAWKNEAHVIENRRMYKEKFKAVRDILNSTLALDMPDAGFYFWIKTPIAGTEFTKKLFEEKNVTVLPGSFLSRENDGVNPGEYYVRAALVATPEECIEAAVRIKDFCQNL